MQVDVVRGLAALRRLQSDWMRVYAADPEGQFFLSWPWMSKRLERRSKWFVLVARPSSSAPPVGFFPVKKRTRKDRRGHTYPELTMPGRGAADYTGFICLPERQDQVARAFAERLRELQWRALRLECLRASAARADAFIQVFVGTRFAVERKSMVMASGFDNAICPYADLPDTWDAYLAERSSNTRQRLRRLLRAVDGTEIRITHADESTLERDIEILLKMWTKRWGGQKGKRLRVILQSTREELTGALANRTLFLPVLWRGSTPIGAAACMQDFVKRELLFQLGARGSAAKGLSPGVLLHAYSIRTAIERGFVRYDFLRGNESYKYSFSTGERQIESIVIRRVRFAERARKLARAGCAT